MQLLSNILRTVVLAAFAVRGFAAPSDVELLEKLTTLAPGGSAPAKYSLGVLYRDGVGTTKDLRAAFRWFEEASLAGDELASYELGRFYDGEHAGVVPTDHDRAIAAKLLAADAGYDSAQRDIGNDYFRKGDLSEAVRWWKLAADQLDVFAKMNLSEAYRKGLGVQKDPGKALELALMASRILPSSVLSTFGLPSRISSLRSEATAEQQASAEQAVMKWKPNPSELTVRAAQGLGAAARLVQ